MKMQYTLDDFRDCVKGDWFTPDDGDGYLHDGKQETKISVWDIDIFDKQWNKYPYVCWYNK